MLLIHQTHQLWGTKCSRQDYKMAGLDPSIIGNLKPPAQMSLSDLMNIATSAQAYKQAQQINPLAVRKQQAETDVSEQTAAPRISSAKSQASTAETGATSAAQTLAEKQQAGIANGFVNRIFDPLVTKAAKNPELLTDAEKQQLVDNTTEWGIKQGKELGINADKASQLVQPYIDVATNNPGALQSYYKSRHIQGLTGSEQNVALTPSGTTINTNQQTYGVNTNPFAGGVGQGDVIPGTQANMGLSPGSKYIKNGTEYYVGNPGQPDMPTTVSPQYHINSATMNTDIANTTQEAASAPNTLNILNTIKETAPQAFIDTGGDKRAFAVKLGEVFGIHTSFDEKATATDIFKKESSMLQSQGNTDAARILNAYANPSSHMTLDAIQQTANQLIAQKQLYVAKQKLFNNFTKDPDTYTKRLAEWNSFADPKLLEYRLMDRQQQQNFFTKLGVDAKGKHEDVDTKGYTKRQNDFTNKLYVIDRLNKQYNLGL